MLVGSLFGMAAGSLLVARAAGRPGVAVFGLVVIGFAAAPVFPLLTLTTADRVGAAHADRTIGCRSAPPGLGGALIPAGIGVLIGKTGAEVAGPGPGRAVGAADRPLRRIDPRPPRRRRRPTASTAAGSRVIDGGSPSPCWSPS